MGLKGSAAAAWSSVAQSAAAFGDAGAARAAARTSLGFERNIGTLLNCAIATVMSGDAREAKKLVDEAAGMPGASNEQAQRGFKFVYALIRWRQGDKRAVDAMLALNDPNDTGATFTLGVVELHEGRTEAAAARFKQIVDRKELTFNSLRPVAPLYYGRALVKMGKTDEGRQAYDQFFEGWKKADADLPLLVSARGGIRAPEDAIGPGHGASVKPGTVTWGTARGALGSARHGAGVGHCVSGHDRGERRASHDRHGTGRERCRPAVDRERLQPHARVPDPDRRLAWRPVRASAGVPRRDRVVRRRVLVMRPGADRGSARGRPRAPGDRRCAADAGQPRDHSGIVRAR